MKNILAYNRTSGILNQLADENCSFESNYPGKPLKRQPVHTLYGGAHLFKSDTAEKMGKFAQNSLADYAPNFVTFAQALGLKGADNLPQNNRET